MAAIEERSKTSQLVDNQVDFESGVYMGTGTFNLVS